MRFRVERSCLQLLYSHSLSFFGVCPGLIILTGIHGVACKPGVGIQIFRICTALVAVSRKLRLRASEVVLRQEIADVLDNASMSGNRREKNCKQEKAKTHFAYDDGFDERWQIRARISLQTTHIT